MLVSMCAYALHVAHGDGPSDSDVISKTTKYYAVFSLPFLLIRK